MDIANVLVLVGAVTRCNRLFEEENRSQNIEERNQDLDQTQKYSTRSASFRYAYHSADVNGSGSRSKLSIHQVITNKCVTFNCYYAPERPKIR